MSGLSKKSITIVGLVQVAGTFALFFVASFAANFSSKHFGSTPAFVLVSRAIALPLLAVPLGWVAGASLSGRGSSETTERMIFLAGAAYAAFLYVWGGFLFFAAMVHVHWFPMW